MYSYKQACVQNQNTNLRNCRMVMNRQASLVDEIISLAPWQCFTKRVAKHFSFTKNLKYCNMINKKSRSINMGFFFVFLKVSRSSYCFNHITVWTPPSPGFWLIVPVCFIRIAIKILQISQRNLVTISNLIWGVRLCHETFHDFLWFHDKIWWK